MIFFGQLSAEDILPCGFPQDAPRRRCPGDLPTRPESRKIIEKPLFYSYLGIVLRIAEGLGCLFRSGDLLELDLKEALELVETGGRH